MNTPEMATATRARARILLVDDHALMRHGLSALIGDQPDLEVCGEAADSVEGMARLASLNPDLAIVDISLKTGHGLDLIRQIRARNECVKILVLSMHDEKLFAERLRAGAMGYVNKEEAPARVIDAIRQVLSGKVALSPPMTERLLQRATGSGENEHPVAERVSVGPGIDGVSDDRPGAADAGDRGPAASEHQDGGDVPRAHQGQAGSEEQRRAEPPCRPVGDGEYLTRFAASLLASVPSADAFARGSRPLSIRRGSRYAQSRNSGLTPLLRAGRCTPRGGPPGSDE